MDLSSIDVRGLREAVGPRMTQRELADRIGVDQSVISRAENNPAGMSLHLLFNVCTALGITLDEAVRGVVPEHGLGIQIDTESYADLELLAKQIAESVAGPRAAGSDQRFQLDADLPGLGDAQSLQANLLRKPHVVLSGPFDAGKSTLVNVLLGGQATVPVRYQPTTSVVTYLRHLRDRPTWCADEVIMVGAGFDPERWDHQDHVETHQILAGGMDVLAEHGSHQLDRVSQAEAALVFVDADILRTCVLVDTPGDNNDDEDDQRASAAFDQRLADVLIYMCPLTGFFSSGQMLQFEKRVTALADVGPELAGRNLFVLLSHASPAQIADEDIPALLDAATARFRRQLGLDVESGAQAGRDSQGRTHLRAIAEVLRDRMFPFYRGTTEPGLPKIRSRGHEFLDDFSTLLDIDLPAHVEQAARQTVLDYCVASLARLGDERDLLVEADARQAEAAERIPELQEKILRLDADLTGFQDRLTASVDQHKAASLTAADELLDMEINERRIKSIIEQRYSDKAMQDRSADDRKKGAKKLAKEELPALMVRRFTQAVESDLEQRAREFSNELEAELAAVHTKLGAVRGPGTTAIPIDMRGAFIGGAMGGVAVGALALWASTLGNLGAYIIAAQAAGWLAALGISLPAGGATLTAAMAALGGPVGIAVGIVLVGVIIGFQFRDDWQTRLAKQISRSVRAKGKRGNPSLQDAVREQIAAFWADTAVGVANGVQAMKEELHQQLDRWTELLDPAAAETRMERRHHIERIQAWLTWLTSLTEPRRPLLA